VPHDIVTKRLAAIATALAMASLLVPFADSALANHEARMLEVTPETASAQAGTVHVLTAKLCTFTPGPPPSCDPAPDTEAIEIDFEIESGPGDISGGGAGAAGNTPFQPDLTCTVLANQPSCNVQYTSTAAGTDRIRAWIDHFKDNGNLEADTTEGRVSNNLTDCSTEGENPTTQCNATPTPGSSPGGLQCAASGPEEPDCTDVVQVTWTEGPAAVLDCNPELADNPSSGPGSTETYTCSVVDANGNPVEDAEIEGENLSPGVNDPDNSSANATPDYHHQTADDDHFCVTEADGTCEGDVEAVDGEAGTATICFWVDTDGNDVYNQGGPQEDGGDCGTEAQNQADTDITDVVSKTWAARVASGVDAEPDTDTNNVNDDHQITATVYDQFGAEFVSGTTVSFERFQGSVTDTDGNTPASPDATCTTANSSSCSIDAYTSPDEGTDRWCVWIGAAPAMTGNNTNGTCDGEALNDPDDEPGTADPPEPVTDDQDVVNKIWQDPGAATVLDCEPETETNPVGTEHTLDCLATNEAGTGISGVNIDAEASGANDPDGGDTPEGPDFTCTTEQDNPLTLENETGTCSFTHGGTTNAAGLTTYRAWIDADEANATVEADTSEGRDEEATPGADEEPDDTDVMEKSWVAAPASLVIAPKADTGNVGACNAFTITTLNEDNEPAQGATIDVEQRHERATNATSNDEPRVSFCTPAPADGPNPSAVDDTKGDLRPPDESPDNVGTAGGETVNATDSQGKITIGIKIEPANGSDGSGNVNLVAFFETTDNDDPESGEPQDTATKTWIVAQGRTIDCEPESDTNPTGSEHTVTCTVKDRDGQPVEGEGVTFTEEGAGEFTDDTDTTQTTNAQGQAAADVTSQEQGTQSITGTITDDLEGNEPSEVDECDRAANDPQGAPAGVCSDSVAKTWTAPECSDGVDNDGDGQTDFPNDPGCESANDDDETDPAAPECSDGIDNDGDGKTDFPNDPGCESANDDDETDPSPNRIDTDIKRFKHGSPFTGDVVSDKAKCERGRKVVVKKVTPGSDFKVGSDRTNRRGAFKVGHGGRAHGDGKFYAKVKKKRFTNNKGRVIVCEKARSRTITVR
jgi:hypothetical protein